MRNVEKTENREIEKEGTPRTVGAGVCVLEYRECPTRSATAANATFSFSISSRKLSFSISSFQYFFMSELGEVFVSNLGFPESGATLRWRGLVPLLRVQDVPRDCLGP